MTPQGRLHVGIGFLLRFSMGPEVNNGSYFEVVTNAGGVSVRHEVHGVTAEHVTPPDRASVPGGIAAQVTEVVAPLKGYVPVNPLAVVAAPPLAVAVTPR